MIWKTLKPVDVVKNARTADLQAMGVGRPVGLHLSQLIQDMRIAAGLPAGTPEGEQDGVRMQSGFLWESAVEYHLAGMPFDQAMEMAFKRWFRQLRSETGIVKQIQLEKDGIHMTPDALDFDSGCIESYKWTWKSMAKVEAFEDFQEHFWPWIKAEGAYCLSAGVDTVRFFIGWAHGNYRKGAEYQGPQMTIHELTYSYEELVQNWQSLLKYRDARLKRVAKKEGETA